MIMIISNLVELSILFMVIKVGHGNAIEHQLLNAALSDLVSHTKNHTMGKFLSFLAFSIFIENHNLGRFSWDTLDNTRNELDDSNQNNSTLTAEDEAIMAEFGHVDDEANMGDVHQVYAVGESEGETIGPAPSDEDLFFAA